ncbi:MULTISPECIES: hypothetical protein [unclassified Mesorhizobium]|uniref:hypothetical protein n=1 Tax=unclassified Mesorhizobium TaxID=325217 RepID=UPI001AEDDB60|nr:MULTISPECIES: hypothetical protein [unclassified Mesorhizobium]
MPDDPRERQRVRALADAIAMEIHSICNLGVSADVMELTSGGDAARSDWMQKFIGDGLRAFEAMLEHLLIHAQQPQIIPDPPVARVNEGVVQARDDGAAARAAGAISSFARPIPTSSPKFSSTC